MQKFPKKIHATCRKIVANYEALIHTGDASGWEHYGFHSACLLCEILGGNLFLCSIELRGAMCAMCPLGPKLLGCVHGGTKQLPGGKTHTRLRMAIGFSDRPAIIKAARARLRYLKRRFKMAGIDLEGTKNDANS